MAAGAFRVFSIAAFQVQPRLFVTLLVQIMKKRRIRLPAQLCRQTVQLRKNRQQVRLRVRRLHPLHHRVQLIQRRKNFPFRFRHGPSIPNARSIQSVRPCGNVSDRPQHCHNSLYRYSRAMRIVVLDGHTLNPGDLSWDPLKALGECVFHERSQPAEVVERLNGAEVALTNKVPISREAIAQLPKLRYIGVTATGFNIVDVETAKERGILVANVPAYGTHSVAQATFALLLELTNRVGHHAGTVRDGRWSASPDFCYWDFLLIELAGLNLGIVGYGRIGRQVATIGRAFGMKILATQNHPRPTGDDTRITDLETLLRESDVVSLHCPLTPQTRELINRDRLNLMKRSAFLLNTSRGPLVNEGHLAEALHAGKIAGAGLDVLSVEPPPKNHLLFGASNCFITPHQAWATRAARQRLMDVTVENLRAFLRGQPMNIVN
jgi:glycerate dehydrogenase